MSYVVSLSLGSILLLGVIMVVVVALSSLFFLLLRPRAPGEPVKVIVEAVGYAAELNKQLSELRYKAMNELFLPTSEIVIRNFMGKDEFVTEHRQNGKVVKKTRDYSLVPDNKFFLFYGTKGKKIEVWNKGSKRAIYNTEKGLPIVSVYQNTQLKVKGNMNDLLGYVVEKRGLTIA